MITPMMNEFKDRLANFGKECADKIETLMNKNDCN
jgi:hypothetical protein